MNKTTKSEQDRLEEDFAKRAILDYMNQYLYTHQVISEREFKLMVEKIATHCARTSAHKGSR